MQSRKKQIKQIKTQLKEKKGKRRMLNNEIVHLENKLKLVEGE